MHRVTVACPDGARIDLDVGSSLELHFPPVGPVVARVLKGQAMFRLAEHSRQRWIVWSGATLIEHRGTSFLVHQGSIDTRVTVFEGRVGVHSLGSAAVGSLQSDLELSSRGQVHIHDGPEGSLITADVVTPDKLVGRSGGQLYRDESLLEMAEDMARYNGAIIDAPDPAIAELRMSGVGHAMGLAKFLNWIAEEYRIESNCTVNRMGDRVITLRLNRRDGDAGVKHP